MREWRLRTSLFLMLVATTVATFLIIGAGLLAWRLPDINRDQIAVAQQQSLGVAKVVEELLNGVEHRVSMAGRLLSEQGTRRQHVLDALVAEEGLSAAYVIDRQGKVRTLSFAKENQTSRADLISMDVSASPLFRGATQRLGLVWSDRYLSVLTAQTTVGLAVPLSDGVLVAELDSRDLARRVDAVASQTDGVVVILDIHGDRVSDHGLQVSGKFRNWGAELQRLHQLSQRGNAYIELNHITHYAGVSLSQKLNWTFLVALPAHWASPRYRTTVVLVIVGFFGSLIVGVVIAPWWAGLMARPLREIIARTQALADGEEVSTPWPRGRVSELNRLAENLQRMSDAIKDREAAVRLSEERLRATIETTPSLAIQWYDRNCVAVFWNRASELFYGYTESEAIGQRIDELIITPEQGEVFRAGIARIADSGEVIGPIEFACHHKDGRQVDTLCTVFAIPDPVHGQLFACMDVDISAVKEAEAALRELNAELEVRVAERTSELEVAHQEVTRALGKLQLAQRELIQSEKLAALGGLVAGVAHELNTPIGNGVMAISTLRDQSAEFREQIAGGLKRSALESFIRNVEDATGIAGRNLERAAELVSSFKQVAVDQTSSQRRGFELGEVVEEIAVTLLPTFKRTPFVLRREVPEGLVMDSYPGPLGQVLTNLINNAIRHGFDDRGHGEIVISARPEGEGWIRIEVADDGKGVTASVLPRIFEPFVTTRMGSGGSGLGLHIVYNLVTGLLGGQVSVSSEEGKGARFTLLLPRVAPAVAAVS